MRVIAGAAKGRALRALRGRSVRPTAGRVREALFSIVLSRFDLKGATILDLFAGTGAVGIEALSRGAGRAVFVEQDIDARRVLRANLSACGFVDRAEILQMPVSSSLLRLERARAHFDAVFVDPPYGRDLANATLAKLAETPLLGLGAWVMVEHHVEDRLAARYGTLCLTLTRRYGKTSLSLYSTETTSRSPAEIK